MDGPVAALVATRFRQHERDDQGRLFDGYGFEIYARHDWHRFRLEGGWNELQPDHEHPGSFRVRYGVVTLGYRFYQGSAVFAGVRIDASRASDRTSDRTGRNSVFGSGMRFSF